MATRSGLENLADLAAEIHGSEANYVQVLALRHVMEDPSRHRDLAQFAQDQLFVRPNNGHSLFVCREPPTTDFAPLVQVRPTTRLTPTPPTSYLRLAAVGPLEFVRRRSLQQLGCLLLVPSLSVMAFPFASWIPSAPRSEPATTISMSHQSSFAHSGKRVAGGDRD